jgi:hypothetical protein
MPNKDCGVRPKESLLTLARTPLTESFVQAKHFTARKKSMQHSVQ